MVISPENRKRIMQDARRSIGELSPFSIKSAERSSALIALLIKMTGNAGVPLG